MSFSAWVFCDVPIGGVCGASYMIESWDRELRRLGVRTRLFTPSGSWRSRSRTATAVTFPTLRHVGYGGDHHARFSSVAELLRSRSERPDVVLVATPGRVGVLGITLAARYSIPLVLVVATDTIAAAPHYSAGRVVASLGSKPTVLLMAGRGARTAFFSRSPDPRDRQGGRSVRLAAHCASALQAEADELVVLSPKSLPGYGGQNGGPPVTVLPAGIDRLPPAPPPSELRWREGALRVLYVGRYAREKSLPLLVRALRLAVDKGVDAHLAMVGEGPLAGELATEAARLGVADRLTLLGPYARSRLGGIYASADVFAFPSVVETQGFVLNEAAHEGLPLLVSDSAANQVVCDGQSALVVPHEPSAYAEALVRLQNPDLRARLGAGARLRAQGIGEATQSAKLATVLRRAIESRAR